MVPVPDARHRASPALYPREIAGQIFLHRLLFGMDAQNEIKRRLKQETSIEVIRGLLAQKEHRSRSSVAESVCQHFGFFDARQRTQRAGCVKALRELERAGHFVLPAAP